LIVNQTSNALNFNEPEESMLLYEDAIKHAESPESLAEFEKK
jgi:hypothetical protein